MTDAHAPRTDAPKPFCFVIMPFRSDFDSVYTEAFKVVVQAEGGFAERVDEQHYDGGILERIQNQISKADFVIADVSESNPNVLYELGYADALGKSVILVTQSISSLPFDLRHRPHIEYTTRGLQALRDGLRPRVKWAIEKARSSPIQHSGELAITLVGTAGMLMPTDPYADRSDPSAWPVLVALEPNFSDLGFLIENRSARSSEVLRFVYLLIPQSDDWRVNDAVDGPFAQFTGRTKLLNGVLCREFKLPAEIPSLPPHAAVTVYSQVLHYNTSALQRFPLALRLAMPWGLVEYPFSLVMPDGN